MILHDHEDSITDRRDHDTFNSEGRRVRALLTFDLSPIGDLNTVFFGGHIEANIFSSVRLIV